MTQHIGADCLEMIRVRHPDVATKVMRGFSQASSQCCKAVNDAVARLQAVGLQTPSWEALAAGLRPEEVFRARHRDRDPTEPKHGWQKVASQVVHKRHREEIVWPQLSVSERASVRSQSGPLASAPLTAFPVCRVTRIGSELFRTLLLRRLRLPLPLSVRSCVCGRRLDVFGHHRAACSRAGVLGRRGFAVESAVEQICREAGARVSTNVMVRDLDIARSNTDSRRLEVVAEGLSVFGSSWLWTRLWSPPTMEMAHLKADKIDGVALQHARRRKEQRYPELSGSNGRARLVVIAGEVGGRWSRETQTFLQCVSHGKAQSAPHILRASAQAAWYRRWCNLLAMFRRQSSGGVPVGEAGGSWSWGALALGARGARGGAA